MMMMIKTEKKLATWAIKNEQRACYNVLLTSTFGSIFGGILERDFYVFANKTQRKEK